MHTKFQNIRTNEQTNERTNERTHERTNKRTHERTNERTNSNKKRNGNTDKMQLYIYRRFIFVNEIKIAMCIDIVHLSKYISEICVEKHARLWKKRQNNANDKCFKDADSTQNF